MESQEEKKMNIIDKIKAKTSRKNRVEGQTATIIGAVAGTVLASGLIVNPFGILALTVIGVIAGVKAGKNMLKVGDKKEVNKDERND